MTFIEPKTIREKIMYDPVNTAIGICVLAVIILILAGVIPIKIYTICSGSVC